MTIASRILDERIDAARGGWRRTRRSGARIVVRRDALPDAAAELDDTQRRYLAAAAGAVSADPPDSGDAWQNAIFAEATAAGLDAKQAFAAIYLAFLGRPNGRAPGGCSPASTRVRDRSPARGRPGHRSEDGHERRAAAPAR